MASIYASPSKTSNTDIDKRVNNHSHSFSTNKNDVNGLTNGFSNGLPNGTSNGITNGHSVAVASENCSTTSSPAKHSNINSTLENDSFSSHASPKKEFLSPFRAKKSKLDYLIENIQLSQEKFGKQQSPQRTPPQQSSQKFFPQPSPQKFDALTRDGSQVTDEESEKLLQAFLHLRNCISRHSNPSSVRSRIEERDASIVLKWLDNSSHQNGFVNGYHNGNNSINGGHKSTINNNGFHNTTNNNSSDIDELVNDLESKMIKMKEMEKRIGSEKTIETRGPQQPPAKQNVEHQQRHSLPDPNQIFDGVQQQQPQCQHSRSMSLPAQPSYPAPVLAPVDQAVEKNEVDSHSDHLSQQVASAVNSTAAKLPSPNEPRSQHITSSSPSPSSSQPIIPFEAQMSSLLEAVEEMTASVINEVSNEEDSDDLDSELARSVTLDFGRDSFSALSSKMQSQDSLDCGLEEEEEGKSGIKINIGSDDVDAAGMKTKLVMLKDSGVTSSSSIDDSHNVVDKEAARRCSSTNLDKSLDSPKESGQQHQQQHLQSDKLNKTSFFSRNEKLRSTAGPRLQTSLSIANEKKMLKSVEKDSDSITTDSKRFGSRKQSSEPPSPFVNWTNVELVAWFGDIGLEKYARRCGAWGQSGEALLNATPKQLEKNLEMKHPLHKKKLLLLLAEHKVGSGIEDKRDNRKSLDPIWTMRWLEDLGLPQYKDSFNEARVDGLLLDNLSVEDLLQLGVTNAFHATSLKRGIQVLRNGNFAANLLKRRPDGETTKDAVGFKASFSSQTRPSAKDVQLWTNHRVMEWLRHSDLSEYAANLRGSGLHGALLILEPRFNANVLAGLLSIPASKSLLRRHVTKCFEQLIGPEILKSKEEAEKAPKYKPLSTSEKLKAVKRSTNSSVGISLAGVVKSLQRSGSSKSSGAASGKEVLEGDDLVCPREETTVFGIPRKCSNANALESLAVETAATAAEKHGEAMPPSADNHQDETSKTEIKLAMTASMAVNESTISGVATTTTTSIPNKEMQECDNIWQKTQMSPRSASLDGLLDCGKDASAFSGRMRKKSGGGEGGGNSSQMEAESGRRKKELTKRAKSVELL